MGTVSLGGVGNRVRFTGRPTHTAGRATRWRSDGRAGTRRARCANGDSSRVRTSGEDLYHRVVKSTGCTVHSFRRPRFPSRNVDSHSPSARSCSQTLPAPRSANVARNRRRVRGRERGRLSKYRTDARRGAVRRRDRLPVLHAGLVAGRPARCPASPAVHPAARGGVGARQDPCRRHRWVGRGGRQHVPRLPRRDGRPR